MIYEVISLNGAKVMLSIWDRVLEPVPMLFVGLVCGAVIAGLLVYNLFWASFYKKKRELKFLNAANGVSNSVMNIVQMGVVAFTETGMLLFNNKTSLKKLRVESLPQSFTEFVEQFITDPEFLVKLKLYESLLNDPIPDADEHSSGKSAETSDEPEKAETEKSVAGSEKLESLTTRVEIQNRIIQFHFSKPFFPQSTLRGWVVVLEDVTVAARQEQQRRLFVSTVSHELKTPLATIKGYCETLLDWGIKEKDPKEVFQDFVRINNETERITAIIGNLTYLSQIENNKEKINMEVYKIDQTVEEVCRRYQEDARKHGIRLYAQRMNRTIPTVFGCKSMMEQMIGNLINNALKYSASNTCIWVYVQATENTVTVKVQDQGKGISKQDAEKIFNAFFRVDETGSRQAGGSGLGLAIVKMMAEVQECEVTLVSRTKDEDPSIRQEVGSDFYITIPTAENVFRETLSSMQQDADRKEVLYRKAKQYMEKVNEDDYDLGEDLRTVDAEYTDLLMERLVFLDEIDYLPETQEHAPEVQTVVDIPQYEESVVQYETAVPDAPDSGEQIPEVYTDVDAVYQEQPPMMEAVMAQELVGQPVVEPVPEIQQEVMQEAILPMQNYQMEQTIEQEPVVHHAPTILVPDPPALQHPFFSKEMIGSQNAERRKKSRAKTIAEKKARESGEAVLVGEKSEPPPSAGQSASMLKRVTAEAKEAQEATQTKSRTRMLFQMTDTSSDKQKRSK